MKDKKKAVYLIDNQCVIFLSASSFHRMPMKWKFHAEGIRIS